MIMLWELNNTLSLFNNATISTSILKGLTIELNGCAFYISYFASFVYWNGLMEY